MWIRDSTEVSAQSYHDDLPITNSLRGPHPSYPPVFLIVLCHARSYQVMCLVTLGTPRDTIRDSQAHPTAAGSAGGRRTKSVIPVAFNLSATNWS